MSKADILVRSRIRKAESLLSSGNLSEAKRLCDELCRTNKRDANSWILAAVTNRRLNLFAEAETCARHALTLRPDANAHHILGSVMQCQGRIPDAVQHYRQAIELEPGFVNAHYYLGNLFRETGDWTQAIAHYRKAVALKPDFIEALSNLGGALMFLDLQKEAWDVLARAERVKPNIPQVITNQGCVLVRQARFDEARAKFLRALSIAPDFIDAIGPLSSLCEQTGRLDEARALLEKGWALSGRNPYLYLVAAKLARQAGDVKEAVSKLEQLLTLSLSKSILSEAHLLLGQAYDRLGDPDRAFEHLQQGNNLASQVPPEGMFDKSTLLNRVDRVERFFVPELGRALAVSQPDEPPVFLVGFPRSGTTLLDQILDSHPKLKTIEEKPMVQMTEDAFLRLAGNDERALASLSSENIVALRHAYFAAVRQFVQRTPEQIIVDRNPANTFRTHLMWRIFPDAKFIFAARHPCDVCLSCFMQVFTFNEMTVHFFTLEDTAHLYNRVVDMWRRSVSELPMHHYAIRYEDLVNDVEDEARKLLDFIGIGWDDAVLKHVEHAKSRSVIRTASYHQVTQPIYQHAKYRWQRYKEHLGSVLRILQPHIEYFGYGENSIASGVGGVTGSVPASK